MVVVTAVVGAPARVTVSVVVVVVVTPSPSPTSASHAAEPTAVELPGPTSRGGKTATAVVDQTINTTHLVTESSWRGIYLRLLLAANHNASYQDHSDSFNSCFLEGKPRPTRFVLWRKILLRQLNVP